MAATIADVRNPKIDVVAEGLVFPEGPSLDAAGNIAVVEIGGSRVSTISPTGEVVSRVTTGGGPNGSAFGPDGGLYVCNNGGSWPKVASTAGAPKPNPGPGSIQRIDPDGTVTTVLDTIDGRPVGSPNDCAFGPDGGLWFTEPIWSGEPAPLVYLAPDGTATIAHVGLRFPNGIGVTDDGRFLVVCESMTGLLWSFQIKGPGQLGEPKPNGSIGRRSVPDGFCFDSAGRMIIAGHHGDELYVLDASDGRPVAVIELPEAGPTNCCFGGDDLRTLYVTSSDEGRLLAMTWPVPGMVLHPAR